MSLYSVIYTFIAVAIMLFTIKNGKSFDTDNDLTAAERHILQKLFLWETMASSLNEFREKKDSALTAGWNNSGPVKEGPALNSIILELERRVAERIGKN
ncbi:conserved hypothetical protein [uncultured Desulfobacterium sp.]|uniref:Uncharacterized protein n=1 Tax=uncultured Desulfobacterium sp. TaxID=201089 RepID=A0A445N1Y4_9BACT|nr:conserved hypothetical protein [uncultured Desulfobacterium sp.]